MFANKVEEEKNEQEIPKCDWLNKNFYMNPSKIKFLGEGTFGKVYHVISKKNESHNALKILLFHEKIAYEMAKSEIRISAGLNHKNIVKILDHHFEKITIFYVIYIVYEIARCSLKDEIKKKIVRDQLSYFNCVNQLVQALKYCHDQEIVHFDLKPANILVFEDNLVKIADWGAAKAGISKGTQTLKTYNLAGTKLYASPELLALLDGELEGAIKIRKDCQKMDVYSLGITLLNFLGLDVEKLRILKSLQGKQYEQLLDSTLKELIIETNFHDKWILLLKSLLAYDHKVRFNIDQVVEFLKTIDFANSQDNLIKNLVSSTGTLDLVFVLDTTGSMDIYIEAIVSSLNNIII